MVEELQVSEETIKRFDFKKGKDKSIEVKFRCVMNMELEEIKRKLRELKPILREKFNVEGIGLFGSYVRGEQKGERDLDVLVEFSEPIGFFEFIELEGFLS